jgi:hypothetical protein
MPSADDMPDTRTPWHRQFWPWFIIALPLTAVVGGLVTLFIAITNVDGLVVDDYYKQGLAINRTLARDTKAEELGLAALARIDNASGKIHVQLTGDQETLNPNALRLQLLHPTRADLDISLELRRLEHGSYTSDLPTLAAGKWHVLLEPGTREWRLTGRIELPGETAIRLGRHTKDVS